jgi:hypothetical protein
MQCSSDQGEHAAVDLPCLDLPDDIGLKIRDQLGGIRIAPISAVTQALKQLLQEKQISDGKRLIVAGRRHVPGSACESGKYFAWSAFAVSLEFSAEWWRLALRDGARDPSRMGIRRRGFGLGSAHRAASIVPRACIAAQWQFRGLPQPYRAEL